MSETYFVVRSRGFVEDDIEMLSKKVHQNALILLPTVNKSAQGIRTRLG